MKRARRSDLYGIMSIPSGFSESFSAGTSTQNLECCQHVVVKIRKKERVDRVKKRELYGISSQYASLSYRSEIPISLYTSKIIALEYGDNAP